MHADTHVRAFRPVLPAFGVQQIRFGFEKAYLGERQFDFPVVAIFLHGQIMPGSSGMTRSHGVGGDDFTAPCRAAAEIGAKQTTPASGGTVG
jgi:hypothetical protein